MPVLLRSSSRCNSTCFVLNRNRVSDVLMCVFFVVYVCCKSDVRLQVSLFRTSTVKAPLYAFSSVFFPFVLFVSKFLSGIYRAFEYLHLYSWVKFQSLVSTYMHCIGSSFLSSAVSSALVSIAGITK